MVKTKIIKTKKIRKITIFFSNFFLQNISGHFYKKNFLTNKKKKDYEYMNAFIKKFSSQL